MASSIDMWMRDGIGDTEISNRLKQAGKYVSRITLRKHKVAHLTEPIVQARIDAVAEMQRKHKTIKGPTRRDVLEQVVESVASRLETGELLPSVGEGIKADATLRSLQERGADRDLMLKIAGVLGGSFPILEGTYKDVTPEALEDAEEFALLTA